jgi:hypothetical protein
MSALYERAWNSVVEHYPKKKRQLVIEEPQGRAAAEAAQDAIKLAERWEKHNCSSSKKHL